ncbi:hypothetical protein LOY46_13560 [Pseudomonas sichuanensis]|uniref:hypothetical protein n=1 Tax=Pseudomonas sichuanensis TaxID=2213015 RepID=UPI00215E3B40|nr:hypothetical protein [Pseudomonas sichuanensis]UVK80623.1 hypothetical protein LOY46_13560 [Pseudomonas sichuanensis]
MKQRLIITGIWFIGLFCCATAAASYAFVHDDNGVLFLHWDESTRVLKAVFAVYATYLGGILVFWFLKPFTARKNNQTLERVRFSIAWLGAVIINLAFLGWLLVGYWYSGAQLANIMEASNVVIWLSFLVAPANIYYFGLRSAS